MDLKKSKLIQSDVLIIGGSTAGCFAAIESLKNGASVVIADKGCAGKAGASILNPGFFAFFREDWGVTLKETMDYFIRNGEYINDREWLEIMLRESNAAVNDLREYGVDLVSTEEECKQEFVNGFGRGTPHAMKEMGFYYMAMTGMPYRRMTPVLRQEAEKRGAEVYDRIMVTQLLKKGDRVIGAVGFDLEEGQPYVFCAKAVVMSAGKNSFRPSGMPVFGCTNDANAMAYRAGADVAGMEFPDPHNVAAIRLFNDGTGNGEACLQPPYADEKGYPPAMAMISPYYAGYWRFCNGNGELIRSGMDLGVPYEVHCGSGPIQWDLRMATRKDYDTFMKYAGDRGEPVPLKVDPDNMKNVNMYGGGASGGYIEQHSGLTVTDTNCASTIPGLFSAGDAAATMCWGAAVTTSYGMMPSAITGKRAGIGAADYAAQSMLELPSDNDLKEALDEMFRPLGKLQGFSAPWVIQQMQNIMTPYYVQFIKSGDRLDAALKMIKFYQEHLADKIIVRDPHELRIAHETLNMLLGAEMMLRSSLVRKESRGGHFREDFPKRDDKNFFAHIRLRKVDGEMKVLKVELPEELRPVKDRPYSERYMRRSWIKSDENMIMED